MYDGYVALTYFDNDTAESAWARASRSSDYCVHASLDHLLLKIRSLPGQDLIGICKVHCAHPIDEVRYTPVTDVCDIVYIGRPNEIASFASLLHNHVGAALDKCFAEKGWVLQHHEGGYQVFFGKGVQVDNHYEYGFPYLYDQDELIAFANEFYTTQLSRSFV